MKNRRVHFVSMIQTKISKRISECKKDSRSEEGGGEG